MYLLPFPCPGTSELSSERRLPKQIKSHTYIHTYSPATCTKKNVASIAPNRLREGLIVHWCIDAVHKLKVHFLGRQIRPGQFLF